MKNPKIVFMGTPEIGATILQGLIDANYQIIGVICREDKPVGRKGIITPPPSKVVAMKYQIPVFQPKKIRLDFEFLKDLKPDLIITCAYGQLVPQELLNIPPLGCINVHGSLLPKYRGASPIQQALIHGDKETGITIMEMINEMDAGKIYAQEKIVLDENENYTSLYQKMAQVGLHCLLNVLPSYLEGKCPGTDQDVNLVTKCGKITKEQEHLSLDYTCEAFVDWVKGLSFIPGGYLLLNQQVFKILMAKKVNSNISGKIGEIVKADKTGLLLQLKDGQVALLEVQKQGKNKMDFKSYLNGDKTILGKILQ